MRIGDADSHHPRAHANRADRHTAPHCHDDCNDGAHFHANLNSNAHANSDLYFHSDCHSARD